MGETNQPQDESTKANIGILLVGFGSFFIAFIVLVIGFLVFAHISSNQSTLPTPMPARAPTWRTEFYDGMKSWDSNRSSALKIMNAALVKAQAEHALRNDLMRLHQEIAEKYYAEDDLPHGNEEVERVIALCPPNSNLRSSEADALSLAYQSRGWTSHDLWWKGQNVSNGIADQEKCLEVTTKWFGPHAYETVIKLPTLAVMYADIGEDNKAATTMQRAVNAANTTNHNCAWYVYTMKARLEAVEHQYTDAMKSFQQAVSLSKNTEPDRPWFELKTGLTPRTKPAPECLTLLKNSSFDRLEQLAEKLRQSKAPCPDGLWQLDDFYKGITSGDNSEDRFAQKISAIQKWLKRYPKSATARICLADVYANYGWFARGSGYANTVTPTGWKLFAERTEQSKAILDADSRIKAKCPHADDSYASIALAQSCDRAQLDSLVDQCHKQWPTYRLIDLDASYCLLPRWQGQQYDTERYLIKRADEIDGTEGDMFLAQGVWFNYKFLDDLFAAANPIKWPRVKAGFKDILAKFPNSLDARLTYLKMATQAGDTTAAHESFDGYHPTGSK